MPRDADSRTQRLVIEGGKTDARAVKSAFCPIAQLVERVTLNHEVEGANPSGAVFRSCVGTADMAPLSRAAFGRAGATPVGTTFFWLMV